MVLLRWYLHHTIAVNEKISLTNSTGTAADAIAITATAGSLDLNAGDNITLDAADANLNYYNIR